MTYLETLYYGINHIAKRHNEIKGINTELTEHVEGDQKEIGGPYTCEYWIIKSDTPKYCITVNFLAL